MSAPLPPGWRSIAPDEDTQFSDEIARICLVLAALFAALAAWMIWEAFQ